MKSLAPWMLIVAGVIFLFAGSSLANIGESIDNLIASKWTATALIVAGGIWLYVTTGHFRRITA